MIDTKECPDNREPDHMLNFAQDDGDTNSIYFRGINLSTDQKKVIWNGLLSVVVGFAATKCAPEKSPAEVATNKFLTQEPTIAVVEVETTETLPTPTTEVEETATVTSVPTSTLEPTPTPEPTPTNEPAPESEGLEGFFKLKEEEWVELGFPPEYGEERNIIEEEDGSFVFRSGMTVIRTHSDLVDDTICYKGRGPQCKEPGQVIIPQGSRREEKLKELGPLIHAYNLGISFENGVDAALAEYLQKLEEADREGNELTYEMEDLFGNELGIVDATKPIIFTFYPKILQWERGKSNYMPSGGTTAPQVLVDEGYFDQIDYITYNNSIGYVGIEIGEEGILNLSFSSVKNSGNPRSDVSEGGLYSMTKFAMDPKKRTARISGPANPELIRILLKENSFFFPNPIGYGTVENEFYNIVGED
jgi:hypothetical protein